MTRLTFKQHADLAVAISALAAAYVAALPHLQALQEAWGVVAAEAKQTLASLRRRT